MVSKMAASQLCVKDYCRADPICTVRNVLVFLPAEAFFFALQLGVLCTSHPGMVHSNLSTHNFRERLLL